MRIFFILIFFGFFVLYSCKDSISPTENNDKTNNNPNFTFKKTAQSYSETDNLVQAVQNEFGSNYRIADWNDVVSWCQNNSASQFINSLSWQSGEGNSLMATKDGAHFWGGTNRHYFITRFDHNLPGHYLSHANIENHYIDIGSWYNIKMKILAIKK